MLQSKGLAPGTQTPQRACATGAASLLLAALLDAVIDGLTAFLLGATLLVALPASLFGSHYFLGFGFFLPLGFGFEYPIAYNHAATWTGFWL